MYQGGFFELTNQTAAAVAMVDGNGDQITGFDSSRPANSALTSVSASITSVTILAANAARRQALIRNHGTKKLYIAFGATASLASFTKEIPANSDYELPLNGYTGVISGIWNVANGSALVTEVTT